MSRRRRPDGRRIRLTAIEIVIGLMVVAAYVVVLTQGLQAF